MDMARKLSNDAFCYLLPLVNSSESGVSIRTERQKVSETYSYNEEETESDSTNLVWKLFEIRHAKLLTVSEFARYQGTSEENWRENVKEFCVGKTENCTSILKLNQGQNNVLTSAQQNAVRELKAALKSRPMRRLRDLQKRKYGTSPLLLGVHGVRMELGNRTGPALELLEKEP